MATFDQELGRRLTAIREQGLYRELRCVDSAQGPRIEVAGRTLVNFSSNDYLGLANHPALKEAAIRAVEQYGAGSGSARLICGSLAPHHELEESLAAFKGTEAALSFSSGYATALGTITALLGKEDIIIVDKLVHACVVDAARLSGAKLRVFAHNDLDDLEQILKWANRRDELHESQIKGEKSGTRVTRPPGKKSRILVVTESIFSMDGDAAPLVEIVALKKKYGAWLMVDEAHATGLYGAKRRGLVEELGVAGQIEIQMGTLGKALGASGGYICGSRNLIDFLINRARSFIFSTAPVPAAAAAARAGIHIMQSSEGEKRRQTLWERVRQCRTGVAPVSDIFRNGDRRDACPTLSAIFPLIVGDESKAVALATQLRLEGFFVPAIRYPTVARGRARLRVTLTAAHSSDDVVRLTSALLQIVNRKS
ncbi:MAG: 8-amino-7-oxononanoate synthase [Verrucomicrobia bacterium]|jgi:7-keto-8-aminopelargonate synthetase-like enzyme|nr:8-amino-7-oxononanoate synthase [Verrucomicrobiota bacterium]